MKLTEIIIKNYKSLERVKVDTSPNLIVLIGKNNSGKSNFLDAINFLLDGANGTIKEACDKRGGMENIVFGKDVSKEIEIQLRFHLSDKVRKVLVEKCIIGKPHISLKKLLRTKFLRDISYLLKLGKEKRYEELKISNVNKGELPILTANGNFDELKVVQFDISKAFDAWKYRRNLIPLDSEKSSTGHHPYLLLRKDSSSVPKPPEEIIQYKINSTIKEGITWISPIRKTKVRIPISGDYVLDPESEKLADVLHTYYTNKPQLYRKIVTEVRRIIPEIVEVLPPTEGNSTTIGITERGFQQEDIFPLENISSGVKNVLAIITHILGSKKSGIVCIEEPEICIHPGMQRELMYFFEEQSEDRTIIISTHSPILASVTDLRNVRMVSKNQTGSAQIEELQEKYLSKLLTELNIKSSDIFDDDIIIFIEGPSDERIMKVFYNKLNKAKKLKKTKGVKIGFVNSESWKSMKYYANIKVLKSRSVHIPYFIIFDGDTKNRERNAQIKEKMMREMKMPEEDIFTLNKNSIEDYILIPNAIANAFPNLSMNKKDIEAYLDEKARSRNKKRVLEQLFRKKEMKYSEKMGEEIAKKMRVPDIEEELVKIFQVILNKHSQHHNT